MRSLLMVPGSIMENCVRPPVEVNVLPCPKKSVITCSPFGSFSPGIPGDCAGMTQAVLGGLPGTNTQPGSCGVVAEGLIEAVHVTGAAPADWAANKPAANDSAGTRSVREFRAFEGMSAMIFLRRLWKVPRLIPASVCRNFTSTIVRSHDQLSPVSRPHKCPMAT